MNTDKDESMKRIQHAVDYCLIGATVTEHQTLSGCSLAKEKEFGCITGKPCYLRPTVSHMRGSNTAVGTIVGYPYGARTRQVKIAEVKRALAEGAQEIILFLNIGYLIEGRLDGLNDDVQELIGLVHMNGALVKTILDIQYLSDRQLADGFKVLNNSHTDLIYLYLHKSPAMSPMGLVSILQDNQKNKKPLGVLSNFDSKDQMTKLISLGCVRIGLTELPDFL